MRSWNYREFTTLQQDWSRDQRSKTAFPRLCAISTSFQFTRGPFPRPIFWLTGHCMDKHHHTFLESSCRKPLAGLSDHHYKTSSDHLGVAWVPCMEDHSLRLPTESGTNLPVHLRLLWMHSKHNSRLSFVNNNSPLFCAAYSFVRYFSYGTFDTLPTVLSLNLVSLTLRTFISLRKS